MGVKDPVKNREYVAKFRAKMKANDDSKKIIIILIQVIMLNTQKKRKMNWELMNIIKTEPNI